MKHDTKLVLISFLGLSKYCLAGGHMTDEIYKNGELHYGTWHDDDGSTYTGYYKNDKAHGQGIYREQNGNTYTGFFKNDDFYGRGTWVETEEGATDGWPGTYKSDNWVKGNIKGYGEYVGSGSRLGCSYKGNYKGNTMENGYGKWTDPDGTWWKGLFKNGEWVRGTTNE